MSGSSHRTGCCSVSVATWSLATRPRKMLGYSTTASRRSIRPRSSPRASKLIPASTSVPMPRRASAHTRAPPSTGTSSGVSPPTRRRMRDGSSSTRRRPPRRRPTARCSYGSRRPAISRCAGTSTPGASRSRCCSRRGCARWCMVTSASSRHCPKQPIVSACAQ